MWRYQVGTANAALPVIREGLDPAWIVHQAPDLLVLNKPHGLLCQPGLGPELADSLISRVQQRWPQAQLVHRLDRDTSGLILVSITSELHRELSRMFAERQVQKRYVADVHGVPDQPHGLIEWPIAKRQHRPPLYGVDPAGRAPAAPAGACCRRMAAAAAWSFSPSRGAPTSCGCTCRQSAIRSWGTRCMGPWLQRWMIRLARVCISMPPR